MKTGILLTNLGTPDAPTAKAVRRYLAEFLWDPDVIDKPRWLWWLILHIIILRIRPKRSARAYQKIWDQKTGSPLLHYSWLQADKLQHTLPANDQVALGMRYGNPSIASAVGALSHCDRIIVLPLYPQYSITTTKSTQTEVTRCCQQYGIDNVSFVPEYFNHPLYIEALANSVKNYWQEHGKPQRLILSFHGLPQRYIEQKGDPYQGQCITTARLLAEKLNLPLLGKSDSVADSTLETTAISVIVTFQSRIGPEPWLQPYTDQTLQQLPKQGITKVHVMCPGFSVDCLETLEEIDMQNRTLFLDSGGKQFHYIPALNDSGNTIALIKILSRQC